MLKIVEFFVCMIREVIRLNNQLISTNFFRLIVDAELCSSSTISHRNFELIRPVYTTEKLGTDPSEKWYGPHIFAHVNNAYHDFSDGYGPLLFSVLGP